MIKFQILEADRCADGNDRKNDLKSCNEEKQHSCTFLWLHLHIWLAFACKGISANLHPYFLSKTKNVFQVVQYNSIKLLES